MKEQNEKQAIEEMARIICRGKNCKSCVHSFELRKCGAQEYAERLYNAGYRKQIAGKWVKSDIPQEKYVCSACGGACWYYDFKGDVAKSRFCPNCGARMKGGAE